MKDKRSYKFSKLLLIPIFAVALTAWALMPRSVPLNRVVSAGCTINGKATYIDGVPTCDCTMSTMNTCACVVTCPPKPGDEFVPEGGGAN